MDGNDLVKRLSEYMTLEQQFYHHNFMSRAQKVDKKEDLVEILDLLHANFLVQKRLFKNLAKEVSDMGVDLPNLKTLLEK